MASKSLATTIALLLTINLLFFTLVSSSCSCPPTTPTKPKGSPPPKPKGSPPPKPKGPPPSPSKGTPPAPSKGTPPATCPPPAPSKAPPPAPSKAPPPAPSTAPAPAPSKATCPKDTLKLGVCADLLNDLVHLIIGTPTDTSCCSLIGGLTDLDAAVCLCTAIKANVLGINLNVPVSLSLLLNYCGKKVPEGFQCA